jgi:hypothetical protein
LKACLISHVLMVWYAAAVSLQVLEWTGQDKAFRLVKKYRGQPWSALPHAGLIFYACMLSCIMRLCDVLLFFHCRCLSGLARTRRCS